MHFKTLGKRLFVWNLCFILILILLISLHIPQNTSHATTPELIIDYSNRVADPDTSSPAHMGFLDIPWLHDGRIWTDKSVRVNTEPDADDFSVTLSVLSQSYTASTGYVIPTDTVFIIDMSGSMYQENIGERPRVAVLVDALNEAINILLDANPRNRIAVVAYGGRTGGYSRAEDILPLGRPELISGATDYFTYRPGSPNNYVDVNTVVKLTASVLVQGSTPTQRGIYNGARILTAASDLTVPAHDALGDPVTDGSGSPLMITRKPNFILMTDGEPTMAWSDYLFTTAPTDTSQTHGDGLYGEVGVSLLTVLTAAHRKRLVHEYYYEDNPAHIPGVVNYTGGGEPVGFYTISLNDVPPPLLIPATMFPFDPADTSSPGNADNTTQALITEPYYTPYPGDGSTESMGELLRDLVSPGTITFTSQYRVAFGNYRWESLSIANPGLLTIEELAFADRFFPADDLSTLQDAFAAITTEIQKQSYSGITDAEIGQESFDGYLVFSDVLGDYMEFRGITGFEFDGVSYSRTGFNQAIINNTDSAKTRYQDILYHHLNYDNMPTDPGYDPARYVSESQVTELIESNIASGYLAAGNSLKYFAYGNRDYAGSFFNEDGTEAVQPGDAVAVVEVFPMWGTLGAPVSIGGTTDLLYITFHVITVLANNTVFEEIFSVGDTNHILYRTLDRYDQMIRWYIPAALIPQRTVDPDDGNVSGNLLPARASYKVGLNLPLIDAGISEAYAAVHKKGDDFCFYTNHHPENVTLAFYQPNELNPYYQQGRPGYDERGTIKSSNPTGTANHVMFKRHVYVPGVGRTDIQWLGNNGRLTLHLPGIPLIPPPPPPPTQPPVQPPPTPPPPPSERAPQTGINSRMLPYVIMFVAGIVLICIVLIYICRDILFNVRKQRTKF